jgi:hypothetical protein
VAEQALASSKGAEVDSGQGVTATGEQAMAGQGAPTAVEPSDEQAIARASNPADLLFGGQDPYAVAAAAASTECDTCDYWRLNNGILTPSDGTNYYKIWASSAAQIWGPDSYNPSVNAALIVVRSDTQTSMLIDDDEIDSTCCRLRLSTNNKTGVRIDGPESNGSNGMLQIGNSTASLWLDSDEIETTASGGLYINYHNKRNLILNAQGGNVGIATTTPDYPLDVKGKIRAYELILESGWADFVFEPGYELMTLPAVEQYISDNGRLPGMPSAAEVREHGLPVAESQALLLQKIEELTLHLIEQSKQLEELRSELAGCNQSGL